MNNNRCAIRTGFLQRLAAGFTVLLVAAFGSAPQCRAWGGDGHQITAYIAADHLTAQARGKVARILGVKDDPVDVAQAMAQAAIRPDIEFRTSAPETLDWHFMNLCRQDTAADERARCPAGNCLTARIDRFVDDLRSGKKDGKWAASDQLAFLINFMGEIHQPLHAITNADMGGKCQGVIAPEPANALHSLWGERMVSHLERQLDTHTPAETAAVLQRRIPDDVALPARISDIAWESHRIAENEAYRKLAIPMQPCEPAACVKLPPLRIGKDYLDQESTLVAQRLALGGYRLAALLNSIWSSPWAQ